MLIKLFTLYVYLQAAFCGCSADKRHSGFVSLRKDYQIRIQKIGRLDSRIPESSGLARASDSTFWTHGDSGTPGALYLFNLKGELLQTVTLPLPNQDWEDLAQDGQGNVYIGDFGNNTNTRKNLQVYQVQPEATASPDTIHFRYADQTAFPPPLEQRRYDLEAFFFAGDSLYLFTKSRALRARSTQLYSFPAAPGAYAVAPQEALRLQSPVTAADISPAQNQFALLGYGRLYLFQLLPYAGVSFGGKRYCLPVGRTGQAEAILYVDPRTLLITNEKGKCTLLPYIAGQLPHSSQTLIGWIKPVDLSPGNLSNPCRCRNKKYNLRKQYIMHTTILITGAMGTVGREVVKQLSMLEGDVRVRAGVHSLIKGENLKRLPGVEIVEVDFENQESLHAAFTHVDKMFLITPFAEDQVEMAKTLVDEAKKKGIKHIVKLSAMGADDTPGITLGRRHREIEQYIEDSSIAYTFLRPTSFMQNYTNYDADSIKREGRFYQSTGSGKVAYIDARDIAAVGVEALIGTGSESKAYDLTGPEALSNQEVAQVLSEVTGRQITFVDVPEEAARQAMLAQHTPEWMTDALLELNRLHKAGYGGTVTDTVQQITGRGPHTFRQFVQDHLDSFI